jgi:hypothetical protein
METSYDSNGDLRAGETEGDDELYQLNDIGLALRLNALREDTEIQTSRSGNR